MWQRKHDRENKSDPLFTCVPEIESKFRSFFIFKNVKNIYSCLLSEINTILRIGLFAVVE